MNNMTARSLAISIALASALTCAAQCDELSAYVFAKTYLTTMIDDPKMAVEPQAAALIGWSNDTATCRIVGYSPGKTDDTPVVHVIIASLTCEGGKPDYSFVLIDGNVSYIRKE